ncbi:hypothetical protein DPMN_170613 [Dreissena polymorpha]|uniref:Uncharacterized protein n=1 Tax=Dreissena polymorpha TaxID=45954 RepID=A0A9D4DWI6_DREPO|nr:hypothetical protein DPMN_170613 [Dreissena polymorpha]
MHITTVAGRSTPLMEMEHTMGIPHIKIRRECKALKQITEVICDPTFLYLGPDG